LSKEIKKWGDRRKNFLTNVEKNVAWKEVKTMKKLFLLAVLVCFVPTMVFAQTVFNPPGTEVDTWAWLCKDGVCGWVQQSNPEGNPQALARLFYSVPLDSACNKNWMIPFKTHASVAQWARWDFKGTRWDWLVRKPGVYCGNCLDFTIWSNQRVQVDFHNFGPLVYEGTTAKCPDLDYQPDPIPIWYTFNPPNAACPDSGSVNWFSTDDLNDEEIGWWEIPDSYTLHTTGKNYKFWNMIIVKPCHTACEYQDHGDISITLLCQKDWIDVDSGFYWDYVANGAL
jgi:hypothetical protein